MNSTRIASYASHGQPAQVLEIASEPLPPPGKGEVLVRMLYAPVNPSDINMLEGTYGIKPQLPAVAGNEGAGRVEATGPGVTLLQPGDLVIPPGGRGTWREALTAPAESLIKLPRGLDPKNAAMLYVNPPTAWRMLHDYVALQPGEWIIQNAANSAVGRCVIQIAKACGWKTINLVRRAELVDELRALGGDVVAVEGPEVAEQMADWTSQQAPRLALNAVGGESATLLAKCLANAGHHVTYGAMSKQSLKLPNGYLIFKDLTFHGFWMTRWYKQAAVADRDKLFTDLAQLFNGGKLQIAVEKIYPLSQAREAVTAALQEKRGGKILLQLNTE